MTESNFVNEHFQRIFHCVRALINLEGFPDVSDLERIEIMRTYNIDSVMYSSCYELAHRIKSAGKSSYKDWKNNNKS
jgi:hypothetical protein